MDLSRLYNYLYEDTAGSVQATQTDVHELGWSLVIRDASSVPGRSVSCNITLEGYVALFCQ
jgi:hypothetical protein